MKDKLLNYLAIYYLEWVDINNLKIYLLLNNKTILTSFFDINEPYKYQRRKLLNLKYINECLICYEKTSGKSLAECIRCNQYMCSYCYIKSVISNKIVCCPFCNNEDKIMTDNERKKIIFENNKFGLDYAVKEAIKREMS